MPVVGTPEGEMLFASPLVAPVFLKGLAGKNEGHCEGEPAVKRPKLMIPKTSEDGDNDVDMSMEDSPNSTGTGSGSSKGTFEPASPPTTTGKSLSVSSPRPRARAKEIDLDSIKDPKERKRARRLLRNRESAQLSRQRKKEYVEDLEKELRSLESANCAVKFNFESMTVSKATLESKVSEAQKSLESVQQAATTKRQDLLKQLEDLNSQLTGKGYDPIPIPTLRSASYTVQPLNCPTSPISSNAPLTILGCVACAFGGGTWKPASS